jgi:hypothetical protein
MGFIIEPDLQEDVHEIPCKWKNRDWFQLERNL